MRKNQSPFEDFVEIMSRIPWWVNVILAAVAYMTLHQIAMTFHEPAPKLELGQMGAYAADKMKGSLALFAQFVIPFGFLLAGLIGLIKKFKRTGQYKELIFYILINLLFFGAVISRDGGVNNAMQKRMTNQQQKQKIGQRVTIQENNKSTESKNEIKALQGILDSINGKQEPKQEGEKIYSWINEKGNRVYSNTPQGN
jgi:hypothetical protein